MSHHALNIIQLVAIARMILPIFRFGSSLPDDHFSGPEYMKRFVLDPIICSVVLGINVQNVSAKQLLMMSSAAFAHFHKACRGHLFCYGSNPGIKMCKAHSRQIHAVLWRWDTVPMEIVVSRNGKTIVQRLEDSVFQSNLVNRSTFYGCRDLGPICKHWLIFITDISLSFHTIFNLVSRATHQYEKYIPCISRNPWWPSCLQGSS